MSEVLEVYSYEYDEISETVHVEAEVTDSMMAFPATQYEPEQWTHGRCETTIFWDVDNDPPLSNESLKNYLDNYYNQGTSPVWKLIPPEDSEDSIDMESPYRTVGNYLT